MVTQNDYVPLRISCLTVFQSFSHVTLCLNVHSTYASHLQRRVHAIIFSIDSYLYARVIKIQV